MQIENSATLKQNNRRAVSHYLNYKYLSNEHLIDTENLTEEKLHRLSDFSKVIDKPVIPGQFISEKHYLDTLKLVLESTNETRNRRMFFLQEILPQLHTNKFLDIGPGDGSVTQVLAEKFKHLTAVDLSHHGLNNLEKMLPKSLDFVKIAKSVLDVDFKEDNYDLASISHMLYYIDNSAWIDVIKKAYQSIKKNGRLVVVLGGDDLGKAGLIEYFGGSKIGIDDLALKCQSLFGYDNVELYASDESFVTTTQEAMFHIASFMLADANINTDRVKLIDYIIQHFKQSEVFFEMTTRQKYIIIKKPNHLNRDIENGAEAMVAFN